MSDLLAVGSKAPLFTAAGSDGKTYSLTDVLGVEAHASYVKKLRFNFPLLSDPDRGIARAYHALKDDGKGIQRSVYVVQRDGTVAFAQRGAPPVDEIVAHAA